MRPVHAHSFWAFPCSLPTVRFADIRERIEQLEEATKENTGLHFQIAINYGGRDEIVRAVKKLAEKIEEGTLKKEEITEQNLEDALDAFAPSCTPVAFVNSRYAIKEIAHNTAARTHPPAIIVPAAMTTRTIPLSNLVRNISNPP